MTFPTPYTVGWHARTNTGPDRFRDPPTYSPPRASPGTPIQVIQWAATQSNAAGHDGHQQLGHQRIVMDVDLFVTSGFAPNPGDLIDLPAGPQGQFEVVSYPQDYTRGFHGWAPGSVIQLRRVEG